MRPHHIFFIPIANYPIDINNLYKKIDNRKKLGLCVDGTHTQLEGKIYNISERENIFPDTYRAAFCLLNFYPEKLHKQEIKTLFYYEILSN